MAIIPSSFGKQASETGATERPKSSEMTPGPGFRVRLGIDRPPQSLVNMFRDFETPDISDILNRMYTMSPEIRNLVNNEPLVGPALTVKVFPGDNLMVHKALDVAKPGDVVVVDTSGSPRNAVLGDLVTNKAKHRGIAGFYVNPNGEAPDDADDTTLNTVAAIVDGVTLPLVGRIQYLEAESAFWRVKTGCTAEASLMNNGLNDFAVPELSLPQNLSNTYDAIGLLDFANSTVIPALLPLTQD